jgi:predicted nucleic acid-binding protein
VKAPVPVGCVVDASTALKWVLQEDGSEAAAALLDGRPLHVPTLLFAEVGNALWSAVRRGRLTPAEAADALHLVGSAPLRLPAGEVALANRALELALLLDHPVYDCIYLALALQHEVPVVTADRRFAQAAARVPEAAPFVRLLGVAATH